VRGDGAFASAFQTGAGSPESVITGSVGDGYWDTTANLLYIKSTGDNTTTGWAATTNGVASWTTYTPTITATSAGTNPTLPTAATITAAYMVLGKTMFLNMKYFSASTTGGVDGTQSYQYSLPIGYTIDLTKVSVPSVLTNTSGSGLDGGTIGAGYGRNATGGNSAGLNVMPLSASTIGAYFEGQTRLIGAGALSMTGASNTMYNFNCVIPID
jgi:hypothetical protein